MRRVNAVLFALLMATMSLAGCFGGDDNDDSEEEPVETLDDWMVYSVDSVMIYPIVTQIHLVDCIMLLISIPSKFA